MSIWVECAACHANSDEDATRETLIEWGWFPVRALWFCPECSDEARSAAEAEYADSYPIWGES